MKHQAHRYEAAPPSVPDVWVGCFVAELDTRGNLTGATDTVTSVRRSSQNRR